MKKLPVVIALMMAAASGVAQSETSPSESAAVLRQKADQGAADLQNRLGGMYEDGKGVPQNDTEAAKWYRNAADQGDADAQYNLGFMYDQGQGVPQDYAEAYARFSVAAALGDSDAIKLRDDTATKLGGKLAAAQRRATEIFEALPKKKE